MIGPGLVDGVVETASGRSVGRRELEEGADRVASALLAEGLRPGDAVGLSTGNRVEFVTTCLAALRSGLCVVPVAPDAPEGHLAAVLAAAGARAAVAEGAGLGGLGGLALFGVGDAPGARPFAELLARPPAPFARQSGSVTLSSSGTTGAPRLVRRPPTGAPPSVTEAYMSASVAPFGLAPGGRHLVAAPMAHAGPLLFALGALFRGESLILLDRWSPAAALAAVERWGATSTWMVPAMLHGLLALGPAERARFDVGSLRSVVHAGAPCPAPVKRGVMAWLGDVVHEYYATVECPGTSISAKEWLARPGSVGKPVDGVAVSIGGPDGCLPPHTIGPVCLTDLADGKHHHPGDLGYLDDDGYLYLVGRANEIIIVGGTNVHPSLVEEALVEHSAVMDAMAYGVPHPRLGELIAVDVALTPGLSPTAVLLRDIRDHARARLPRSARPTKINVVPSVARTAAGKLDRRSRA